MVRIRRFGIIRTATVVAALYAVLTMVAVLLFLVPFTLIAGSAPNGVSAMGAGIAGALLFGVFGTVIYALIGWIMTAIACALYNFVARWVGGIEVQLESVSPTPAPAWGGPYAAGQPFVAPPGYGPTPGYGAPMPGYGAPPSGGAPGTTPPPPPGRPA